jgi:hypothetical protein
MTLGPVTPGRLELSTTFGAGTSSLPRDILGPFSGDERADALTLLQPLPDPTRDPVNFYRREISRVIEGDDETLASAQELGTNIDGANRAGVLAHPDLVRWINSSGFLTASDMLVRLPAAERDQRYVALATAFATSSATLHPGPDRDDLIARLTGTAGLDMATATALRQRYPARLPFGASTLV